MPFLRYCTNAEGNVSAKRKRNIGESGFPPGVTVDELFRYRKRKPQDGSHLEDHVCFGEGSYKSIVSEYTRSFKSFLKLPNIPIDDLAPSNKRTWNPESTSAVGTTSNYFLKKNLSKGIRSVFDETMNLNEEFDKSLQFSTEISSKYVGHEGFARTALFRPEQNLKIEGDLSNTTESAEQFIEYLLFKREHLLRKPTTLRLEGEMEKNTENREQFIAYDYQERPRLCKKSTNLRLEGDRFITTENHEKFLPHKIEGRQPLLKTSTNLHLEGDLDLHPEYKEAFIEHKVQKQSPLFPTHNIKIDGSYDVGAETKSRELHHPLIPFLRGGANYGLDHTTESKDQYGEKRSSRAERRRRSTNLKLEGSRAMTPEYRNAYVDFYESGRKSPVKRTRGRAGNLKNEGEMVIDPEYSSAYVNFPRERPRVKRPECHLKNTGEMHHITEKESVFVPYDDYNRPELLKRDTEMKLEGRFECQPEYRKAYRDYLIRERVERKPRPLDNLIVSRKDPEKAPKPNEEPLNKNLQNKKSYIPISTKKTANTSSSEEPKRSSASTISSSATNTKLNLKSSKLPLPQKQPQKRNSRLSVTSSSSRLSRSLSPAANRKRNLRGNATKTNIKMRAPSPEGQHQSRVGSRFSSPVRVADLAYRPVTSPLPWLSREPSPEKRDNRRSVRAFVVLDKRFDEGVYCAEGDRFCNGKRWVPSWYAST